MGIFRKTLGLTSVCLLICTGLFAQTFDLSSQRKEEQRVRPVPGQKIDHQGIVINPTPQSMTLDRNQQVSIAKGFNVVDKKKAFAKGELEFLSKNAKGLKLTIDFGGSVAFRQNVKPLSGAYSLIVNAKGVNIVGYDERGAFYGLQTLRQLLESPVCKNSLPVTNINDYPDLPNRGVVEGFYGNPWSHQVRISLINFYGRHKMNIYLYGPKDDPYHSSPNWRLPYPEQEEKNIRELIEACNRNRVEFVWAIHPGADIQWNEADYQNLVNKFERMYNLGVRSYALFFDDINGEGTNPNKQVELINRLDKEFVKAKGDVASLTFCPTDYSKIWADPKPTGALATYGNTMDKSVKIFWTGDYVCSDLTKETMDWFNERVKRPGYYWWNCPVTDMCRHIVMQSPAYGLDTTLTADDLCGILSNPMEYGEASKIQLYGMADYAWNVKSYNPMDAWERSLVELMPQCSEAYRTFAIHSGDTETVYRRAESWENNTMRLDTWNDPTAISLYKEFAKMETAEDAILAGCTNPLLLNELRPWLKEMTKLGERGRRIIELAYLYRANADDCTFWSNYVRTLMTSEELQSYMAHRVGTLKMQPFYVSMMSDMGSGFMNRVSGRAEALDSLALTQLDIALEAENANAALAAFDNNAVTSYRNTNTTAFNVKEGAKTITLLTNKPQSVVTVSLLDVNNKVLKETTVGVPMTRIALCPQVKRVRISGAVDIYEIVVK